MKLTDLQRELLGHVVDNGQECWDDGAYCETGMYKPFNVRTIRSLLDRGLVYEVQRPSYREGDEPWVLKPTAEGVKLWGKVQATYRRILTGSPMDEVKVDLPLTRGEAAKARYPGMTYDHALPDSWLLYARARGHEVVGHFVWLYDDSDSFVGRPGPITPEGDVMMSYLACG